MQDKYIHKLDHNAQNRVFEEIILSDGRADSRCEIMWVRKPMEHIEDQLDACYVLVKLIGYPESLKEMWEEIS